MNIRKNKIFLIFLIFFFLTRNIFCVIVTRPLMKYDKIYIKYKISGNVESGYEEIFRVRQKWYKVRDVIVTSLVGSYPEKIIEFDDGKNYYKINLLKKIGEKRDSVIKNVFENPSSFEDDDKTTKNILKKYDNMIEEEDAQVEILGKKCNVYKMIGVTNFTWNNIILKVEMDNWIAKNKEEAVQILFDDEVSLPDFLFKVPSGIEITEKLGNEGVKNQLADMIENSIKN